MMELGTGILVMYFKDELFVVSFSQVQEKGKNGYIKRSEASGVLIYVN